MLYGMNMKPELKTSIIIGISLGLMLSLSVFMPESYGLFWAIITCILFGSITVWRIKKRPNVYAMLISFIAWVLLTMFLN